MYANQGKRMLILREVCLLLFVQFLLVLSALGAELPAAPSPDLLESGDLIWPKKPGAVVALRFDTR